MRLGGAPSVTCSSTGLVDSYVCPRPGPARPQPGRGPPGAFSSARLVGIEARLARGSRCGSSAAAGRFAGAARGFDCM
eukprot:scaffold9933_cov125-Isochrysis_galbana.AAC.1